MKIVELLISSIIPASYNPREMEDGMRRCLANSLQRFGLVVPLVVRLVGLDLYETVAGALRLAILREMGVTLVPCVVVHADDAEARLLSQVLNHIAGQDNPGKRAAVVRSLLADFPMEEVLAVLPESGQALQDLASLDEVDIARQLQAWEQVQKARLKHRQFHLLPDQLPAVERALRRALPKARDLKRESPNLRGTALYIICLNYLRREDEP